MRSGRGGGARDPVQGTATFVFTDLVGSTELIDRLGDDISDPLIRAHLARLGEIVSSFGGRVVKSLGDGLMAAFTSAAKAVDAAVVMQQAVEQMDREAGHGLALKVGIHSGEATWDGTDYYGKPVWVAKRLCDAAGGGQILCSDVVRDLAGGRGGHPFAPVGPLELKGVGEPVDAYAVGWEAARSPIVLPKAPSARGVSPVLVAASVGLVMAVVAGTVWATTRGGSEKPSGDGIAVSPSPEPSREATVSPIRRIDKHMNQNYGNDDSGRPALSNPPLSIVFASKATLDPSDKDSFSDIYLVEPETPALRLSIGLDGTEPNGDSFEPAISADGERVAFTSAASNLVESDDNGELDVFVVDVSKLEIARVSERRDGTDGKGPSMHPDISSDGSSIVFASDARNLSRLPDRNHARDIFVHDPTLNITNRISVGPDGLEANGGSDRPSVSANGDLIAFESDASNLIDGDDNSATDVFLIDRNTVPAGPQKVSDSGGSDPSVGRADGSPLVAFASMTDGGSGIYVSDIADGRTHLVSADGDLPSLSANGRVLAFSSSARLVAGDEDDERDVYLRDLVMEETFLVSDLVLDGGARHPAVSADGSAIVFEGPGADDFDTVGIVLARFKLALRS